MILYIHIKCNINIIYAVCVRLSRLERIDDDTCLDRADHLKLPSRIPDEETVEIPSEMKVLRSTLIYHDHS